MRDVVEEIIPGSNEFCIREDHDTEEPDRRGIGYVFYHSMLKFQNNVAQIDGKTGKIDKYEDLLKRCIRTAINMRKRGIQSGDMITLCSHNHFNSIVPFIASFFLGCNVSSLDPTMSSNDCIYLTKQVKPKIIFASEKAEELIESILVDLNFECEIVIYGKTNKFVPFDEFLESDEEEENNFEPYETKSNKETGVVFFSSGTTGMPKGICTTHFGLLKQGQMIINAGYDCSRGLSYASLYWISSAMLLSTCIGGGYARIIAEKFDPHEIWHLIERHKVTYTFLAPSQAILMYKAGRPEGIDTTSLTDMIIGGGSLNADYINKLKDLLPGTNISLGYGQTEVTGLLTIFRPKVRKHVLMLNEKIGSSGQIYPGIKYKIVDLETEEAVGPHVRGELRIKTSLEMNGYYNSNSSDSWDENGWLCTGDVAFYDEDHCIYIVDRIKEMLKFQSWHVPPAIIEAVLHTHPAVKMGVVIGIPHLEDGDHPMAVIIPTENYKNLSADDIIEYVNKRVDDRQKLRGGIKFVEMFPLTPSGKIKRKELKENILSELM